MRHSQPPRCVVFLHLPKTAGSTLRSALLLKYPSTTLLLDRTSDPEGGLADVPPEVVARAEVVTGHLDYGIHEHLPRPCEYITVLREPIARVVSMYRDARRNAGHRLHRLAADAELEDFLAACDDPGLDNLQTRMISGRRPGVVSGEGTDRSWTAPPLDDEDLEAAKQHLRGFLVVGLTERFDETFILIRRALGWRLPIYERRNSARSADPFPSEGAVAAIRERNLLDLELYECAVEIFESQVAAQGPSLRREVAAFRVANSVPSRFGSRIPASVRHSLRSLLTR
jgi:hypothetical protein